MVTYVPTILMNMLNQATNYITGNEKYSMVYTINITCMMVLGNLSKSKSWWENLHFTPWNVTFTLSFLSICLPVCLKQPSQHLRHQTCWDMAFIQFSLPIYDYSVKCLASGIKFYVLKSFVFYLIFLKISSYTSQKLKKKRKELEFNHS